MRQPFLQRFRDHQGVAEIKPVILWMENWERDKEEPESSPLTNYLESQVVQQKPWLCVLFLLVICRWQRKGAGNHQWPLWSADNIWEWLVTNDVVGILMCHPDPSSLQDHCVDGLGSKEGGPRLRAEPMVHSWVPLDIAFSQREPICPIRSSLQAAHFQWPVNVEFALTSSGGRLQRAIPAPSVGSAKALVAAASSSRSLLVQTCSPHLLADSTVGIWEPNHPLDGNRQSADHPWALLLSGC